MKNVVVTLLAAALLFSSLLGPAAAASSPTEPLLVRPAQFEWQDVPAFLPRGAKMALLEGDPRKEGAFTLRLRLPPGYRVPLHTASTDEHVTVIFGQLMLTTGAGQPQPLPMRSYASLPAHSPRAFASRGMTVLQLSGNGPWELRYAKEADDPRKQTPAPEPKPTPSDKASTPSP